MKYFALAIIIVLGALLVWVIFFSGLLIHKKDTSLDVSDLTKKTSLAEKVKDSNETFVLLETNFGPIKIALDKTAALQTAANFEKLVKENFYNGLTFHRIVPGFVIQGGDPKGDGTGGPGYTLPAEIKLLHKRGSVAMARLSDQVNPKRDSSGSQFYIALQDLPQLDGQYTVFGQVISGMEIVDKIATLKTDANDKPLESVIINKAYIEK